MTSAATAPMPAPRWKQLLAQAIRNGIKDDKSILYYSLATLSPPHSLDNPSDVVQPHVRTVVHRGFLNEQRLPSSSSSSNGSACPGATPGTTSVDARFGTNVVMLTTTDVRSPKAEQIRAANRAAERGDQGKGGARSRAEVCWWLESANLQFRIAGNLYLVASPSHPTFTEPPSVLAPLRRQGEHDGAAGFDWASERRRIFDKLSPSLLASFARPKPGTPHPNAERIQKLARPGAGGNVVDGSGKPQQQQQQEQAGADGGGGEDPQKDDVESPWPLELPSPPSSATTEEQKALLAESEKNFALVLLAPDRVDVVDLTRDKRSVYELVVPANGGAKLAASASAVPPSPELAQPDPNGEWVERRVVP